MSCFGQVFLEKKIGTCSHSKVLNDLMLYICAPSTRKTKNLKTWGKKRKVSFKYIITTPLCLLLFSEHVLQNFLFLYKSCLSCVLGGSTADRAGDRNHKHGSSGEKLTSFMSRKRYSGHEYPTTAVHAMSLSASARKDFSSASLTRYTNC